ncbi:hypothetical protein E2I00_015774, partial [Balaenoptera physalus]
KQLPLFTSRLCFSKEEKTTVKRTPRGSPVFPPNTTRATNSRYSVFDILRDELETILKGVLENSTTKDRPAVQKAKTLYRSCMNESEWPMELPRQDPVPGPRGPATGHGGVGAAPNSCRWELCAPLPGHRAQVPYGPLLDILEVVGGWPVAMDKWSESIGPRWELEQQLAVMNARFNRRVLIDLFIWNDDHDSSQHIIYVRAAPGGRIDQPTLGMPSREHYFSAGSDQKGSRPAAMDQARQLLAKTGLGASAQPDAKELHGAQVDEAAGLCPHPLAQVREAYLQLMVSGFNWTLFIQSVLSSVKIKLLPDEEVVVYGIPYLQNLEDIIDVYSSRTMQNYLVWRLVLDRISSLSQRFKDARANYRKALYGTTVEEVRWRECVSYVNSNMESAVGSLYVKEAFPGDSKNMVRAWRPHPGPGDTSPWHLSPQQHLWNIGAAVVNAFYSPNRNQIVFPAGILQPPFFSKEQPQALNFGGIGMVIGHEITHGFDDNGRNFDKNGNMMDWWSNFSAQHFRKRSECMVYQYGNYSWDLADDQNVNGFSTLGENIADNGGVRQAYKVRPSRAPEEAYLKWVAEGGKDQQLPGLELTYEQLFFISYAQVRDSPLPHWLQTGSPLASLASPHERTPPGTPWRASQAEPEPVRQEGFLEGKDGGGVGAGEDSDV